MIKKLLPLFMIFTFAIGIVAETDIFHDAEESIDKVTPIYNVNTLSMNELGDNCEDNGCHDSEGHCAHHCSGVHNVTPNQILVKINMSTGQTTKLLFYYINKYQTLTVDPALKPPTFS